MFPKKEYKIPARDGHEILVRIYNHHLDLSPLLVFYPGCGYLFSLFEVNAIAASRIAEHSGIKVAVVDFRLCPESPLPIPVYDGYDAAKYIYLHAGELRIDREQFFVGGISSGAHCAAVVSNLARKDTTFNVKGQFLVNGIYDFSHSLTSHAKQEAEDKMVSRALNEYIVKQLRLTQHQVKAPLYSPYFEKYLSNLPYTLIVVSEYDGLRSHSEGYFARLESAGIKVEKIVLKGQVHDTMLMRKTLCDGPDPAEVVAQKIKEFCLSYSQKETFVHSDEPSSLEHNKMAFGN